jgi:hypothetical protein
MFVGNQTFTVSWGRNFVGNLNNVIGILFMKIKDEINTLLWGCKFVGKGGPRNPRTFVPHEQ